MVLSFIKFCYCYNCQNFSKLNKRHSTYPNQAVFFFNISKLKSFLNYHYTNLPVKFVCHSKLAASCILTPVKHLMELFANTVKSFKLLNSLIKNAIFDVWQNTEEYLKPCQTTVMELFCINIFENKLHHRCLTGF